MCLGPQQFSNANYSDYKLWQYSWTTTSPPAVPYLEEMATHWVSSFLQSNTRLPLVFLLWTWLLTLNLTDQQLCFEARTSDKSTHQISLAHHACACACTATSLNSNTKLKQQNNSTTKSAYSSEVNEACDTHPLFACPHSLPQGQALSNY